MATVNNKVFGEVTFDVGWDAKVPVNIELWGKLYAVEVTAMSYCEEEGINETQEKSFAEFKDNKSAKQKRTEELLLAFYKNNPLENLYHKESIDGCKIDLSDFSENIEQHLPKILKPKFLEFNEEGECALLFDDEIDPDNGIAVVLLPKELVMTQDEYL
jgi:hypothetical protein